MDSLLLNHFGADTSDVNEPPLDERDRVFPRLGEEPPSAAPKRWRVNFFPFLFLGICVVVVALFLMTNAKLGWEDGRLQLQWGPVPRCEPFGHSTCSQLDAEVVAEYSDATACNKPERVICIVPIGGVTIEQVDDVIERLTSYLPVPVAVAPPLALPAELRSSSRAQYDGEAIAELASATYADTINDPGALIIALTAADIYLPSNENWRYAFGVLKSYDNRVVMSVVSTARMSYVDFYGQLGLPLGGHLDILVWPGESKVRSRAYKMVLKYVGLGYFGLPLTADPTSVMYNHILSPDDLDRMNDELPLIIHP
jgi:hypothetical protein